MTADRGVFRFLDGGATWAVCEGLPREKVFTGIALSENNQDVIFVASIDRVVYRNDDYATF
jgi:hypothetical protein